MSSVHCIKTNRTWTFFLEREDYSCVCQENESKLMTQSLQLLDVVWQIWFLWEECSPYDINFHLLSKQRVNEKKGDVASSTSFVVNIKTLSVLFLKFLHRMKVTWKINGHYSSWQLHNYCKGNLFSKDYFQNLPVHSLKLLLLDSKWVFITLYLCLQQKEM